MPGLLRRVQSWRGSTTKETDTSYDRSSSDSYLLTAISEGRPASCTSLKSGVTRSTKASSTLAPQHGMQPCKPNHDSLLGKLTKRLGRGSQRRSPHKKTSSKEEDGSVDVNSIRLFPSTESVEVKLDEDVQQAVRLDLQAEQEEESAQYKTALLTLEKAVSVSDNNPGLETKLRCKIASLHLKLVEEKNDRSCNHVEAARLQLDKVNFARSRKVEKWLYPSQKMLDLLIGGRKWESALAVANQLKNPTALCLARLHFEIAMNQNDFDQHIQECHQLLLSVTKETILNEQDKNTLFDLWQDLAEAYTFKEDYDVAATCHESMLTFLTDATEIARVHYQFAIRICIPNKDVENALAHIDAGLNALQSIEDRTSAFYFKLLRMKADVFCRIGRMEESLQFYEKLATALNESPDHSPADVANVLYTMGKVCIREKGFERALGYFQRELEMTSSVVGMNHMAVSRILHEIANVADHGLGDHELALSYLRSALEVETNVLRQCLKEEAAGKKAGASAVASGRLAARSRRDGGSNSSQLQDAQYQIGETQRCMGRIHYKMGDFESAMRLSMEIPVL